MRSFGGGMRSFGGARSFGAGGGAMMRSNVSARPISTGPISTGPISTGPISTGEAVDRREALADAVADR